MGTHPIFESDFDCLTVPPREEIEKMTNELKVKDEKLKDLKTELRSKKQQKSGREATVALVDKLENIQLEKNKLKNASLLGNKGSTVDVGMSIKLKARVTKLLTTWRSRRKKTEEIIDTIMDQFPKSKAEFVDEVGLELTTIPIPNL